MFGRVPVGVDVRRREDLRHRARLLVGRAAGRRLGEHRLGVGVRVALLLAGAEAAVVALADRLDRRWSARRSTARPCPSGPPPQPVWNRPRLPGRRRCSRGSRARRARSSPCSSAASPGTARRRPSARPPSASAPIQCFWKTARCPGRSASRRTGCAWRVPPGRLELLRAARRRGRSPTSTVAVVALGRAPCRRGRKAADEVDGVVELLRAHARALDVAEALGPAVVVGVEAGRRRSAGCASRSRTSRRGSGRRRSSARSARRRSGT